MILSKIAKFINAGVGSKEKKEDKESEMLVYLTKLDNHPVRLTYSKKFGIKAEYIPSSKFSNEEIEGMISTIVSAAAEELEMRENIKEVTKR